MACDPVVRRSRGFTLIEMLVVLLIMGLLVGLVGALARPDDAARVRVEADRLGQLLVLAATESRLTGESIAWVPDAQGYRFWRTETLGPSPARWSEIAGNDPLRARTLPPGMRIASLLVENMPVSGAMRLEFVPHAPAPSFTIGLVLGAVRYLVAASPIGEVQVRSDDG